MIYKELFQLQVCSHRCGSYGWIRGWLSGQASQEISAFVGYYSNTQFIEKNIRVLFQNML